VLEEFVSVGHSILKELEQQHVEMLEKYESSGNDVAEKILRIAYKQEVDTIVVGDRRVKASKEFLMGSVSYKVTHYAKCPVIIVR
jgi:nucleotide-binding universal stress UspA family protein